jgi:hypothetical protein
MGGNGENKNSGISVAACKHKRPNWVTVTVAKAMNFNEGTSSMVIGHKIRGCNNNESH